MRPVLRKSIKAAAAKAGVNITRAGGEPDRHTQRRILLQHYGTSLVLDIGANVGQYGRQLRGWTGYTGRIASFEPGADAYHALSGAAAPDSAWDIFHYGLSNKDADLPLAIPAGHSDLSSITPLTSVGTWLTDSATVTQETVSVRRLDQVIGEIARPSDSILLKLDVQGHEAEAIAGATQALTRVSVLECELPLVAMYEGQRTFAEMLGLLADHGFGPVGMFTNYVDHAGNGMDADVFFVRG